ncbi:TPA: hypothetical protein ACHKA6_000098 [Escherichia coli]
MPAVDLSQLPEPAIIAEPDFEAILADTKAMMIAAYPADPCLNSAHYYSPHN